MTVDIVVLNGNSATSTAVESQKHPSFAPASSSICPPCRIDDSTYHFDCTPRHQKRFIDETIQQLVKMTLGANDAHLLLEPRSVSPSCGFSSTPSLVRTANPQTGARLGAPGGNRMEARVLTSFFGCIPAMMEADQTVRASDSALSPPSMAVEESRVMYGPRRQSAPSPSRSSGRADASSQTGETHHE